MLNDPLPARRFEWRPDRTRNVGILDLPGPHPRIEMPLKPMLFAPLSRRRGRSVLVVCGLGISAATWTRPMPGKAPPVLIFHDGAYFYFGDGHARQGDGEICGSGPETTMDVTFQFDLVKGR